MTASPVGVGVIGLGFMGCTHARAYQAAARAGYPCRLAAVCDPSAEKRSGQIAAGGNIATGESADRLFDAQNVRGYERPEDLLADRSVGLVSICTYTDSHVDLAIAALNAGKHVLVEKPIALDSASVRRLADATRSARTLCMPAMCMRFWPGWDWLHARIADRSLGSLRSVTFTRLGSGPTWAGDFYRDLARSGGALFDLHIHDTDFVYWCFGRPRTITSVGDGMHVTTLYGFESGPAHVVAEGAWDLAPKAGFRMRFLATFERGTAEFDINRTPWLALHTASATQDVELPAGTGYDWEIRHLVEQIAEGSRALRATMDDAVAVAELLELERAGQTSRAMISL